MELVCLVCKRSLDELEFCKQSMNISRNGRHSYCKICKDLKRLQYNKNLSPSKKGLIDRLLYHLNKRSIKKFNSKSDITSQDINILIEKQNNKCAYSNIEFTYFCKSGSNPHNLSIDRIDSSKSYTIDNIQLVCSIVNIMKNSMSDVSFVFIIREIYKKVFKNE